MGSALPPQWPGFAESTTVARDHAARTRWLAAALLTLTVALMADGAVARATASPAGATTLDWSECGAGFQCATAEVPRDYSRGLRREPLELAVIRRPATDPAGRVGSVFLNPGGPGASGVAFVRGYASSAFAA